MQKYWPHSIQTAFSIKENIKNTFASASENELLAAWATEVLSKSTEMAVPDPWKGNRSPLTMCLRKITSSGQQEGTPFLPNLPWFHHWECHYAFARTAHVCLEDSYFPHSKMPGWPDFNQHLIQLCDHKTTSGIIHVYLSAVRFHKKLFKKTRTSWEGWDSRTEMKGKKPTGESIRGYGGMKGTWICKEGGFPPTSHPMHSVTQKT